MNIHKFNLKSASCFLKLSLGIYLILKILWIRCCCLVTKLCQTLCNPMDCSTPDSPVLHNLPEFAQIHVHGVSDTIQSFYPLFPFSSCTQSFPASESSPMCQLFALGGPSIGHSLQKENHNHRKLTKMVTGITAFNEALSHAMRATQDGWVMVESFDKTWSTGEGDVKPLHYSCSKNSENSIKSIRRNYIII